MRILILALMFFPSLVLADFFPQAGQVLTYQMIHWDVDGNDPVTEGEFVMEAVSTVQTAAGVRTDYISYSSTFPNPQKFSIYEGETIVIEGITYIGPGSDEVFGDRFTLARLPLALGQKHDTPLMLADFVSTEQLEIGGKLFDSYRVSLIGSWGHYYTMAGNYWLVPGLGIARAEYTTVDGRHVQLNLLHRQ